MKKHLNEVKRLQKIAGILKESDMASEAPQLKTVHIDDKRMPGGRPSEIEKDYGLKVTPHEDGTFSVTGEVDKLVAYLEDYGIVSPQENVNEAPQNVTPPVKIDDDGEPGICPACREHCTFYPDDEGDLMSDCCGAEMD